MKRILFSIVIIAIITVFTVTAFSASPGNITISANSTEAYRDGTTEITISVSENMGVSYLEVSVIYDKSALTLNTVSNGVVFNDMTTGKVSYSWYSEDDLYSDGILMTLEFSVNHDAEIKEYPITLICYSCKNSSGNDISYVVNGGVVNIANRYSDMIYVSANPASCTSEGNTEYWYSPTLNKYFLNDEGTEEITREQTVIQMMSHSPDGNGWYSNESGHYYQCICGEILDLFKHDNAIVTDYQTEITVEKCTVCGYISEHIHAFGTEWITDSKVHFHECECGATNDNEEHTFGQWVLSGEESSEGTETRTRTCTVCDYVEIVTTVKETDEMKSDNGFMIKSDDNFEFGMTFKADDVTNKLDTFLDDISMSKMENSLVVLCNNADIISAHNLYITLNGGISEKDGKFKITAPIPYGANDYDNISVIGIDTDGRVSRIATFITSDESAMSFTTEKLGLFAVIGVVNESDRMSLIEKILPYLIGVLVSIPVIATVILIIQKKRNND